MPSVLGLLTHITSSVRIFGLKQGVSYLAEVVLDLYDAALRESSRRTYGTGQRAYIRFISTLQDGVACPFQKRELSDTELNLAFFMAFLLLEPKITAAGTILGYESHVKYQFKEEGCEEYVYSTPFLKQVRKGIRNTLPGKADRRGALLLPLLTAEGYFNPPDSNELSLLRFATIIGFVGMLRPHTFRQLKPSSFTLVTYTGRCTVMPKGMTSFRSQLSESRRRGRILGFYIDFQSKTMRNARAYLPSLCSRGNNTKLAAMCPVRALIEITKRGLVKGFFLRKTTKRKFLSNYLKNILGSEDPVALYALRIGGRTWKISMGMDRQMVDFLGTWKSPEASARYFRGNPREVLMIVRQFYRQTDPTTDQRNGDPTQTIARGS